MKPADIIILLIVLIAMIFAARKAARHFKGDSLCCGGGGDRSISEGGPSRGSEKSRFYMPQYFIRRYHNGTI